MKETGRLRRPEDFLCLRRLQRSQPCQDTPGSRISRFGDSKSKRDCANLRYIEAEVCPTDGWMLVGHSFGGLAINGVVDAIPDRIRHLVYLDSLMVEGARARSTSCRRISSPRDARPPRKPMVTSAYLRPRRPHSEFRCKVHRMGELTAHASSARHLYPHCRRCF